MIAKYDDFNRFCQPVLTLTNPEGNALGICDDNYIKNFIFTPRFNDVSEISFDFFENDSPAYKKITPRMRIFVEGYGSFIISTVREYTSAGDSLNYKSVNRLRRILPTISANCILPFFPMYLKRNTLRKTSVLPTL